MQAGKILWIIGAISMTKRLIFILLILQGCATAFDDIFLIAKNQVLGYPNQEITEEFFAQAEFSFMTLKVGRNPKVKLTLNSINDGLYEWVSEDLNSIFTYNGLIVRSSGLPNNIYLRNFESFMPSATTHVSSILEFDRPLLAGVVAKFTLIDSHRVKGNAIYQNLTSFQFNRMVDSIGWKSEDTYWVNDDNLVVYSLQEVHPHMKAIELEYFYKF
jgi:hypothetical protein